jgi:hypothetical protein
MSFTSCAPRSSNLKLSFSSTWSRTTLLTQIPPRLCQRLEARRHIDAVAKNVVAVDDDVTDIDPDTKVDPQIRWYARIAPGHLALHVDRTAHRIDHTGNSRSRPSPVVLTILPPYSAIFGSMSSRRCAFNPARVALSSRPMSSEYPTTSADTIAASRRWSRVKRPSPYCSTRLHHRGQGMARQSTHRESESATHSARMAPCGGNAWHAPCCTRCIRFLFSSSRPDLALGSYPRCPGLCILTRRFTALSDLSWRLHSIPIWGIWAFRSS